MGHLLLLYWYKGGGCMKHREYVNMIPGADTAVLFIHGIVGTPNHFVTQIPMMDLVPDEWSVYNVLLDGHGFGVDEFSDTSMEKWKKQVWRVFARLAASHERVVIVAHSMGTLFAMQLALENPEKIPLLFLIGVPMRPGVRLFGAVNSLRIALNKVREDRPLEVAMRNDCGLQEASPKLWKYIRWIPRFLELFREISLTEKRMGELKVECVAYQSRKDELVTNQSKNVLIKSGVMDVVELEKSTHCYYDPEDTKRLRRDFLCRCEEIKQKKA